MKKYFLILSIFSFSLVHSQRLVKEYYDYFKTKIKEELQVGIDGFGNGYYKKYYENGHIQEKGGYINGKPTGIWSYYSEGGALWQEDKYNNKGYLLEHKSWYSLPNRPMEESTIYDPTKFGESSFGGEALPFFIKKQEWYQSGKLKSDFEYKKYEKRFYENGKLSHIRIMDTIGETVSQKSFSNLGVMSYHMTYDKTTYREVDSSFYPTGKIEKVIFLKQKKEDSTVRFNKSGEKMPTTKFINGQKFEALYKMVWLGDEVGLYEERFLGYFSGVVERILGFVTYRGTIYYSDDLTNLDGLTQVNGTFNGLDHYDLITNSNDSYSTKIVSKNKRLVETFTKNSNPEYYFDGDTVAKFLNFNSDKIEFADRMNDEKFERFSIILSEGKDKKIDIPTILLQLKNQKIAYY